MRTSRTPQLAAAALLGLACAAFVPPAAAETSRVYRTCELLRLDSYVLEWVCERDRAAPQSRDAGPVTQAELEAAAAEAASGARPPRMAFSGARPAVTAIPGEGGIRVVRRGNGEIEPIARGPGRVVVVRRGQSEVVDTRK